MSNQLLHFAIDGNEANVLNRVGSNVYAYEILLQFYELTKTKPHLKWTILLSAPPVNDLPTENVNWRYQVVGPKKFWTQWALPIHLFKNIGNYDLFYTPGHYAPRFSPIPYVSTVMDLAFLEFPDQFTSMDLFQLKHWTKYSVRSAKKVITISNFSKQEITQKYNIDAKKIKVAYPAFSLDNQYSKLRWKSFVKKNNLKLKNYFLYLGTIQPRKNLETLIDAFEIFNHKLAASQVKSAQAKTIETELPQLVIAGKTGWLADSVLQRIKKSPIKEQIVLTGFVENSLKKPLYEQAKASCLIGLYEGFGIPPLESLSVGTPTIVANNSSLPEAVGEVGFKVPATDPTKIATTMLEVWRLPKLRQKILKRKMLKHVREFSWSKSAQIIFETLLEVINQEKAPLKTWDPFKHD
ncbi:MAG: glycosyltransferase family 4 protein [Candidatus Pacebacteria bacterium]|nr:glycosyltransferase family 4 protein [Candidatus Paceibacterota bacterium]